MTAAALLILSGCVNLYKSGPHKGTPDGTGIIYNFLVHPMSEFVDLFAKNMHMGYGWAIIIVTLIVRFIILPLGLNQAYRMTYNQEKTAYLAPVFKPINDRLQAAREAKDQQAMMAAQQELMKAQKDNGVSMLSLSNMGCLPMLIQYPFFMALYYAARYTNGISSATFFGIDLGKTSIVITIFAGVFYLLQTWISTFGMSEEQRKQSQTMLWISPLMIVIFSYMSPAGVALYWAVGGIVMVVQQMIITFIMKPRMRKRIDEEFKANPPKMSDLPKNVTPAEAETQGEAELLEDVKTRDAEQHNRNAGKQKK